MSARFKPPEEWFKQAEYDFETANAMFETGRYIYAVFMCHLSIEKALKGLYAQKFKQDPSKIHNLNYFCEKIDLQPPEEIQIFIDKLNSLSVPTRYPDELDKLMKDYKKDLTKNIVDHAKELLLWLKKKL